MTVDHDIKVLTERGDDLVGKARYQDAVKPFDKATKLLEERRGKLDESTLNSREQLADTLMSAGDIVGATNCHLEIVKRTLENLQRCQSLSGSKNSVISAAQKRHLDAQRRLADTYLANNDYGKAISTYQAIVDTEARKPMEDVIKDRVDLTSALFGSGSDRNIMKAVNVNIETLDRAEQSLGRNHIETVRVRFNLAKELFNLKKYNDASTRCLELLDILQAGRYKGGEESDHLECLKDTKKLLRNCSAKIVLQEEDSKRRIAQEKETAMEKEKANAERRATEAKRRAAEQVNKGRETKRQVDKEIEAIKKATQTEWKEKGRTDPKHRNQDPPATQKERQTRKFDDAARTTRDRPSSSGQEAQDESNSRRQSDVRKKASSPINTSSPSPKSDKRAPNTPQSPKRSLPKVDSVSDRPRAKDTSKDDSARSTRNEQAKHQSSASTVSQSPSLTKERLRELDRKYSTSGPLGSKVLSKDSLAIESKADLPKRPQSASAVIRGSDRTEERSEQSNRRHPSRNELIERSQSATPDKGRRSSSTVSRSPDLIRKKPSELERVSPTRNEKARTTTPDQRLQEKAEARKAQPAPESGVTREVGIPDQKHEQVDSKRKKVSDNSKSVQESQTPDRSAGANRWASAGEQYRESNWLETPVGGSKRRSEQLPSVSEPSERQDSEGKVHSNRTHPGDERVSRTVSAPSITITEHSSSRYAVKRKDNQEPPIVEVESRVKIEGERPTSSHSNYEVASLTSNTGRKREPRSASTDSRRFRRSSETPKDTDRTSPQILGSKDSVSNVDQAEDSKKPDQVQQAVDQSSRTCAPSLNVSADDTSKSARKPPSSYKDPFFPTLEETQKATPESPKDLVSAPPKSDRAQPENVFGGEPQNDDNTSASKAARDKQLQSEIPSEPLPIFQTDTLVTGAAEWTVPGGWHRDFDEPDPDKKARRARSNERIKSDKLRVSQAHNVSHRRTSSVDLPRQSVPTQDETSMQDDRSPAEVGVDEWFENLRENAHVFLDKYQDDSYKETKAERRVKIAVIDSGVARKSTKGRVPGLLKGPKIKRGTELHPSLPWDTDTKGHGTHAAGLILDVCPYAHVYVYRVCEGNEPIEKQHVADAITDAVKKKVDIISMSLGWQLNDNDALDASIQRAREQKVLLFAASSNEGIWAKSGMAYPARAMEVIAVDSANAAGRPSNFNPFGIGGRSRFTVPGERIRSTWPVDLPTEERDPGFKRLTGTSCATPIAAGIAGLLLEFSRQRPMCFDPRIERWLKRVEDMRLVLEKLLSRPSGKDSLGNMHLNLNPTKLFCRDSEFPEGGDWAERRSPRLEAAYSIAKILNREHGGGIGFEMDKEVDKEVIRRHQ
ncbi:unnamed protein product [Alternaria alternata]